MFGQMQRVELSVQVTKCLTSAKHDKYDMIACTCDPVYVAVSYWAPITQPVQPQQHTISSYPWTNHNHVHHLSPLFWERMMAN